MFDAIVLDASVAAASRDVPVVMFSSSAASGDVSAGYAERANAYMVKLLDALEF